MSSPAPRGPNNTAAGWSVTGQQEATDFDAQGRAVQGVRVSFQTAEGVNGSVFVPRARYTPENVRAEIIDYVQRLQAVHKLSG